MADYSQILKGAGVSFDRAVTKQFGSIVEDQARGSIARAIKGGSSSASPEANTRTNTTAQRNPRDWISSSYASHLATGDFRPKLKFLFKVEFKFKSEVINSLGELGKKLSAGQYSFLITKVDRPKFEFEYEDSVNQYNFNTKVLRKIKHRELSMSFMDDTGNRVHDFFSAMVLLFSPIVTQDTETQGAGEAALWPSDKSPLKYELGSGMAFSNQTSVTVGNIGTFDLANRRAILSNAGNAIECIRVKQMFVDTSSAVKPQFKEIIYDYVNPRIMSFDLDELTHDDSNPNILNMTFDFDWMEMVKVENLDGTPSPVMNKPLSPEGSPFDILGNAAATTESAPNNNPQGNNNPFVKAATGIAANVARQATQKITNEAINSVIKTIPGNGRFASMITQPIGSALSSTLTTQFGNKASSLINDKFVPAVDQIGTSIVEAVKKSVKSQTPPVNDSASTTPGGTSTGAGGN